VEQIRHADTQRGPLPRPTRPHSHIPNDFSRVWVSQRTLNILRMDAGRQIRGGEPVSQFVELAVEDFTILADATRVRG
jgi:hypothetical protein